MMLAIRQWTFKHDNTASSEKFWRWWAMMRDVSHTSVNRNGRAVGDSRHVRVSASLSWIFATALRNTCASS